MTIGNHKLFFLFLFLLVLQRAIELAIAKSHEKKQKERGGFEVGKRHYRWMVIFHVLFFISLVLEVIAFNRYPAFWWWIPFSLFFLAQWIRIWSMTSLGDYWNTKIIIVPGSQVIVKGPYKYMRHPNYAIVITEIMMGPLIFQAYYTAAIFTIMNIILLAIRIPIEEDALSKATNYDTCFQLKERFIPKLTKE